jgi:H+-transporting ATPase
VINAQIDFAIIAAILLVNGLLGFKEEYHAKKSLDEISNSIESEVTVRRNGEIIGVPTKELVPGDIILLVGGTAVPADTKWLSGDKVQIDTAALTGEPLPRTFGYPSTGSNFFSLAPSLTLAPRCPCRQVPEQRLRRRYPEWDDCRRWRVLRSGHEYWNKHGDRESSGEYP